MIDESVITQHISLVADATARRTVHCPPLGQVAAYVDARLDATARAGVEEHLADCTDCLGQIGFLVRESRARAAQPLPSGLLESARRRPTLRFRLLPRPALTALAATALLLAIAFSWRPDPGFDPSRSRPDSAAQSHLDAQSERSLRNGAITPAAPRVVMPGDGAVIDRLPMELRWSDSPGALQYAVQVLSLEGDLVWEGLTAGQWASIPPGVELEPGQKYYVWVEAQLRNGATSRSEAVAFRVAPD